MTPGGGYGVRPWFRVGQVDVTTPVLVVSLCLFSMVLRAVSLDAWLELPLRSGLNELTSGEVWRIVTWPLANEVSLWVVITLAVFWYFGTQIEGLMGRRRFLWLLGLLTVIPGLVGTFLDLPQAGIRPVEFGVFLVFIAEYPFIRFFFGIPAWVLGAVFLGIEVLQIMSYSSRAGDELIFLFVTLAVAALTARAFGLVASLSFVPRIPLPSEKPKPPPWSSAARKSGRGRGRRSGRSPRTTGDIVEGPWSGSGPGRPNLPAPPADPGDEAELDVLLDKINAGGIDSLTGAEKRRLNELSKRLRDRGTR